MYMYMYVYMYVYRYVYIHTHIHIYKSKNIFKHGKKYMHICMHEQTRTCICVQGSAPHPLSSDFTACCSES